MAEPLTRIYVNVNEEGEDYDAHDNLVDAIRVQDEFPNDTISVRLADTCLTCGRPVVRDAEGYTHAMPDEEGFRDTCVTTDGDREPPILENIHA